MKTLPKVSGKHVDEVIGEPHDYIKNKQNNYFQDDADLTIPQRKSEVKFEHLLDLIQIEDEEIPLELIEEENKEE